MAAALRPTKIPRMTRPINASVLPEAKMFWVYFPQFNPRGFATVRNVISKMAKNCWQERLNAYFADTRTGALIQDTGETEGASTPRKRANAPATAAIVPVCMTRKSVQPYRKPQSGE